MAQTFSVDGPLQASIKLGAGRVDVGRAEPGAATVEVAARDATHEPSVRAAAEAVVRLDGRDLRVEVPEHGRLFRRAEVLVTVQLPAGSDVDVRAGAADVAVTGGANAVAVKNGAGDVSVDTAAAVAVKSGSTRVVVGSADAVAVTTGDGHLRADSVGDVSFKTGVGEVDLTHTRGEVAVKGGAVQLRIAEAGPGAVLFDTGAGSATVGVVAGTSIAVDLTSGAGDVRCDVPLEGSGSGSAAGLTLRLRTGAGDLRVHSAAAQPAQPA